MSEKSYDSIDASHFLRDWNKLPVAFVRRGEFPRLPFETQGVFVQLLAYCEDESQIPGWFLDKESGRRLSEDEIVYQVAGSVDRIQPVQQAIGQLKRAGILAYSGADGWSIPHFAEWFSTDKERKKIRDANKVRQRRKRAKDRAKNVVQLREEATG